MATVFGKTVAVAALALMAAPALAAMAAPALADDVAGHIDAARADYQKGDIARTAHELDVALNSLQDRLGNSLSEQMPPVPAGWTAEDPEVEGLGGVGGGLSVSRAFTKGDASLNLSILLDSPAVDAARAQFANPNPPPNIRHVRLGTDDALVRWDDAARSGEATVILGNRVLVQIEGDGLATDGPMVDLIKGVNLAGIRKVVGL